MSEDVKIGIGKTRHHAEFLSTLNPYSDFLSWLNRDRTFFGCFIVHAEDVDRQAKMKLFGYDFVISPASKRKSGQLEWFRKFAYCDYEKLIETDRARMYAEFTSWFGHEKNQSYLAVPLVPEYFTELQAMFSNAFKSIMEALSRAPESAVTKWRKADSFFYRIFEEDPLKTQSLELLSDPLPVSFLALPYLAIPFKRKEETDGSVKYKWKTSWKKTSRIKFSNAPGGHKYHFLLFKFFQALEGLTFDMCIRCEECGQWFFHLARRKKMFCSNRCAKRKDMREYRKKIKNFNYNKHRSENEEGRLRAKLSYLNRRGKTYPLYKRLADELREQIAELKKQKRPAD